MARKVRFEYPGATYHVLNRGNYRRWIFEDDGTKASFEKALFEACERCGWVLHAYVVMGNHFHLALETPEPNLSEGMRWLGSVFALRFNRYRKENGALFQSRYKSIVVEDYERLAWLCHYIHLNPVRAGICEVAGLAGYRFGSYRWLREGRKRPAAVEVRAALEGAGGLADTPRGRRKYEQYLEWLVHDEPRMKSMLFDRMSKGWALGTKAFKSALLEDEKKATALAQLGEADARGARELRWEAALERCLKELRRKASDSDKGSKGEDWKVAIAGYLKTRRLCRNRWIAERLGMGSESAVSRYVSQMLAGDRPEARRLYDRLDPRIKL